MMRLLTLGILLLIAQTARAENDRPECPGLQAGASAEQQAQCWFERAQSGATECSANKEGVSPCARHAANWCAGAVFDDPALANTCFLAHLRSGQLEQAQSVRRYLHAPTEDVGKCRNALEAVKVNVVTVPAGAEVLVNGYSYGKSPVKIELRGQWWNDKVVAIFDDGVKATEVKLPPGSVTTAFDKQKCVMASITIKGPSNEPKPEMQAPHSMSTDSFAEGDTENRRPFPVLAVLSLSAGGAGLITGGILLAVAATRASYLRSLDDGTTWTSRLADKDRSLLPLSIGGGVALAAGAALATVGIVLLTNGENSPAQDTGAATRMSLSLSGQGIQWQGKF